MLGVLHLIHPALVHATLAFLVAGGVVEAYGIAKGREGAERFGGILVVAGTISLVPTIAAGFLAENALTLTPAGGEAVDDHERLGLLVLGVFVPLLLVKAWGRGRRGSRVGHGVLRRLHGVRAGRRCSKALSACPAICGLSRNRLTEYAYHSWP
jgi:uncharacterized membrane protein